MVKSGLATPIVPSAVAERVRVVSSAASKFMNWKPFSVKRAEASERYKRRVAKTRASRDWNIRDASVLETSVVKPKVSPVTSVSPKLAAVHKAAYRGDWNVDDDFEVIDRTDVSFGPARQSAGLLTPPLKAASLPTVQHRGKPADSTPHSKARESRDMASSNCKERPEGRRRSRGKGASRDFVPWCDTKR